MYPVEQLRKAQFLNNKLRDVIHSDVKKSNKQTLALKISKSFDGQLEKNIFLSKPALKLLNEEIKAATYIHNRKI